jgi:adenylate kinase
MRLQPLLFFGYPGSGKTIQAKKMADYFDFSYLSTGNLVKDYIKSSENQTEEEKKRYRRGVPQKDSLIINLVEKELEDISINNGIIFDNFPFNKAQNQWLDEYIKNENWQPIWAIYLDISKETVYKRLSKRQYCSSCHQPIKSSNKLEQKRCQFCQGEIVKRPDDKKEIVKKRIDKYRPSINFLKEYFSNNDRLAIVDGEPRISQVSKKLVKIIDGIIE